MESGKSLKDMTLEELWELFPINLVPYDPQWKDWANEEIELLKSILTHHFMSEDGGVVINHIGSTAIEGIYAKPIIDILVEVADSYLNGAEVDADEGVKEANPREKEGGNGLMKNKVMNQSGVWDRIVEVMERNGYILMARDERLMSFNKGYTQSGYAERVFHIHFHQPGDNDEILFRDYLRAHPEVAEDYENLKMSLLPKYRHNRDGYTEAKTEFVKKIVKLAGKLGGDRDIRR